MGAESSHCCSAKDTARSQADIFEPIPLFVDEVESIEDFENDGLRFTLAICQKRSIENNTLSHTQDFLTHLPNFANHMGPPKAGQMAQVFTVVNHTGDYVKCLLEAPDGGRGEEFMLLPGAERAVKMTSQYGLLSIAFCENDGNRIALAICQERVLVQAGVPFSVSPQDKHLGNRRYEKPLCKTTDLVQAFGNMSLTRACAEIGSTARGTPPLIAHP